MMDLHVTPRQGRPLALALVALLPALAASWLTGCGGENAETTAAIVFKNAGPGATYVGSAACTECHAEEAKAHASSRHARSAGTVDVATESDVPGVLEHERSAMVYRLDAKDGGLRVRQGLRMDDDSEEPLSEHVLTHWIGSGVVRRAYMSEEDGFAMLAPLVREAGADGWQIDPNCDQTLQPGFARPVDPTCVRCHMGRAERVDGSVHRYRFLEEAISCERCHGPGSVHVEHQRKLAGDGSSAAASDGPDRTIVNPADLSRERAIAICAQCHMDPTITVRRAGKQPGDWQPALPWEAVQITYRPNGRPDAVPAPAHVDQLAASRCYTQAPALTCSTCHDAHAHAPSADVRAMTNKACATCHENCDRPPEADQTPTARQGEDCATCHMPAAEERTPHVVFHDHRISVPGKEREPPPSGYELSPFLGDISTLSEAQRDRAFTLAAWRALPKLRSQSLEMALRAEGTKRAEKAHKAGIQDTRFEHARALSLLENKQLELARQTLTAALAAEEKLIADGKGSLAPEHLAEMHDFMLVLRGRVVGPSDAHLVHWEALARLRRDAADWVKLSLAYGRRKLDERSLDAMLKARSMQPTHPGLWRDTGTLLNTAGRRDEGARADKIANRLSRQQSYIAPRKPK